jgi:hypothetical protein
MFKTPHRRTLRRLPVAIGWGLLALLAIDGCTSSGTKASAATRSITAPSSSAAASVSGSPRSKSDRPPASIPDSAAPSTTSTLGSAAGATVTSPSVGVTTPTGSLAASTGFVATGSVSVAAALPAPLEFSHRIGFIGGRSTLFKIVLSGAEVTVDGTVRTAVVHTKVTNFSIEDQFIGYVKTPSLLLPDGSLLPMKYKTSTLVPGGGTTPLDLVAQLSEPSTFTFAAASLVFGNNASAQTIIPLDNSAPVSTFAPIVDVGKGVSADSGVGTKARITGTILHADYEDGAKATLQLEVAMDVSFSDTAKIQDIFSTTLTTPDGTSVAPANSVLFGKAPNGIVLAGRTVHGGLLFDIPAAYAGTYALTIHSDRVKDAAGSGAANPILEFKIPRER